MKARALVIGMALAALWAGCGLTAVGSHEDAPVPEAGVVDATRASVTETSVNDTAPPPVPPASSSEIPIGDDLDAGVDADLDASTDATTAAPPAFEIIAPAGGKLRMIAPGEILPCSTGGFADATFDVKNLSSEPIRLGWVNYACYEVFYGVVSASTQVTQPTYVGHRWRIRSDVDAGIRGDFVIDAPGKYTVIVR